LAWFGQGIPPSLMSVAPSIMPPTRLFQRGAELYPWEDVVLLADHSLLDERAGALGLDGCFIDSRGEIWGRLLKGKNSGDDPVGR